jgi:GTP-binding protein HflX
MKKTHQVKEKMRAILVDVIDSRTPKADAEKRLIEMENLVNTYGGIVVMKAIQKRGMPDYDTYIGKGKLDEIIKMGEEIGADILIINNILKPKQVFNIDEALVKVNMKSWDRVDLILKILINTRLQLKRNYRLNWRQLSTWGHAFTIWVLICLSRLVLAELSEEAEKRISRL